MSTAIGVVIMAIGAVGLLFSRRMACARVSLHFSYEDLRATAGPRYRRVKITTIVAYGLNLLISAFWIYAGGHVAHFY
jgi:hypothetical protein